MLLNFYCNACEARSLTDHSLAKLSATSTSDVVLKVIHQHLKWTFFCIFVWEKNGCYFCSQLVSQKFLSAVAMNASKGHGRTNVFHTCCCCRGWSWREVGVIIRKTHSVLNSNKSKSLEIVCTYLYWNYQRIRINKYFFKSSGV